MTDLDLTAAIEAARARINHSHTAGRCWLIDEDLEVIARDAVDAAAPVIEELVRRRAAAELLAAGADPMANLAWMYPEQAAVIVTGPAAESKSVPSTGSAGEKGMGNQ